MTINTANFSLPKPEASDPPNGPSQIGALADELDDLLGDIALSQLRDQTAGKLLIANGSGVITGTAMSGDVTISPTGVTTIAPTAVGEGELASNAVSVNKIQNGAVSNAKLGGGITNDKLAPDSIWGDRIGDAAIASRMIAGGQVQNQHIATDAVTSDKCNLSFVEDVMPSDSLPIVSSSGETILFTGSDRAGGVSLLIATVNVLLDGGSTPNLTLYLNVYSGSQVRYVTSRLRMPAAPSGGFQTTMTLAAFTPASATWAPNVSVLVGAGTAAIQAGSRLSSFRLS